MTEGSTLSMMTAVVASQQQISCDVADEAVLLSMQTGQYYGLNPVAASIWKLIQEPRTIVQLLDALVEEYEGVTKEECRTQLLFFLDEMISLELVEVMAEEVARNTSS